MLVHRPRRKPNIDQPMGCTVKSDEVSHYHNCRVWIIQIVYTRQVLTMVNQVTK